MPYPVSRKWRVLDFRWCFHRSVLHSFWCCGKKLINLLLFFSFFLIFVCFGSFISCFFLFLTCLYFFSFFLSIIYALFISNFILFFIILSFIHLHISIYDYSRTFEWALLVMVNARAGDGTVQAVRFTVYRCLKVLWCCTFQSVRITEFF